MTPTRSVATSRGPVEALVLPGDRPPVLFLPGGHCTAASDCGWSAYSEAGHGVVAVSRPGYGRTEVGPLTAAEFAPLLAECLAALGIGEIAAVVGVSFGGLTAVRAAAALGDLVPRLVLHSCAPSSLPYPDSRAERAVAPVAFSPAVQALTWAAVRRLVASDRGLRTMVGSMAGRPVREWWDTWDAQDRSAARSFFGSLSSGSGFALDLSQAAASEGPGRRRAQQAVPCPTLVTASRDDGSVAYAHAEDLVATVPAARLVETGAPSHLFWLGPEAQRVRAEVRDFLAGA